MNWFKYLGLAGQIIAAVQSAEAQLAAGQPVEAPGIRTYIGNQHVEIDLSVKPL